MALNDVKEITIPEGSVKKIENASGKIIWGSQSAFPYRRLEYIHFNGTDNYLNLGIGTKSGYYRRFDFTLERNNVRQSTFCCFDGTVGSAFRRYYAADFEPTNGVRFCCGSTWSTGLALSNVPLNARIRIDAVNSTVSNKPRMQFNFRNTDGTYIISTTTINGTTNGSLTHVTPYLMACHTVNTGVDIVENPSKGKVFYFEERRGTYKGNLTHEMNPCQRKSDGVCGLYDVQMDYFYPMSGTDTTDPAAGPIVDEYWDLTRPA